MKNPCWYFLPQNCRFFQNDSRKFIAKLRLICGRIINVVENA